MPRIRESVETANSTLRTLLALVVVGMIAAGGWFVYATYVGPRQALEEQAAELVEVKNALANRDRELVAARKEVDELSDRVEQQAEQIIRLETAQRLLKFDHRIAELRVVEQRADEQGNTRTKARFSEVTDEGVAIGEPLVFSVRGDKIYIEYNVVKFEDQYVEQADLARGTTIALFQRAFGEFQEPQSGYTLDAVGSRPNSYARGGQISDFEQQIWDDFWNIANDPEKAAALGIRSINSEADGIVVKPGMKYIMDLRASDGLSIRAEPADEPEELSDAALGND